MKKTIIFILPALLATTAWGQAKLSPMTRLLETGIAKETTLWKSAMKSSTGQEKEVAAFIKLKDGWNDDTLRNAGVKIGTIAGTLITARIPAAALQQVAALPDVEYIEVASPVRSRLDEAKKAVSADKVLAGDGLPTAYTGKGVVIGIVDGGFDYGHLDFWDTSRSQLRVRRVWNQNVSGNAPEGFSYGTEYATQEAILAARTDGPDATHATHVTGIAAGSWSNDTGDFRGAAPDADIVMVSLSNEKMNQQDNTAVIDGINYIFRYAESAGKPCVVNLSIGSHYGPHDGTSAFDTMADALQGPGRLIVGAAGNEGKDKLHASLISSGTKPDTLRIFPQYQSDYSQLSTIDIWGDKGMSFSIIPVVFDIPSGKVVKEFPAYKVTAATADDVKNYAFTKDDDNLQGELAVAGEISPLNSKPHATAVFSMFRSDSRRAGFYVVSSDKGTVHMWADDYYSTIGNFGAQGFTDGNSDYSVGEVGGTGKRIVSVGASVSRDHWTRYGIYYPSGEKLGALASFSSHGPTADERVKPDITAPGTYLISALSSAYEGSKRTFASETWNEQKYEFGYMQGTSMASPLVTGVLATWLEAYPKLSPEEAKDIFHATATNDDATGEIPTEGSNLWGAGKLNAREGLKRCISYASTDAPVSENDIIVLRQQGQSLSLTFTTDAARATAALYTPSGTQVAAFSFSGVQAGEERSLSPKSLAPGIYILRAFSGTASVTKKIVLP